MLWTQCELLRTVSVASVRTLLDRSLNVVWVLVASRPMTLPRNVVFVILPSSSVEVVVCRPSAVVIVVNEPRPWSMSSVILPVPHISEALRNVRLGRLAVSNALPMLLFVATSVQDVLLAQGSRPPIIKLLLRAVVLLIIKGAMAGEAMASVSILAGVPARPLVMCSISVPVLEIISLPPPTELMSLPLSNVVLPVIPIRVLRASGALSLLIRNAFRLILIALSNGRLLASNNKFVFRPIMPLALSSMLPNWLSSSRVNSTCVPTRK